MWYAWIWLKSLFSGPATPAAPVEDTLKPQAKIAFVDGRMRVESYNSAFIDDLKVKMGELTIGKSDDDIVQLFLDREAISIEEPRLDVQHFGITEEGHVQMKLDWNTAFIKHLKQNGIEGETEEMAVNKYLALITKNAAVEEGLLDMMDPMAAAAEMDEMLQVELQEAAKQVEAAQRQSRKANRIAKKAKK